MNDSELLDRQYRTDEMFDEMAYKDSLNEMKKEDR